MFQPVPPPCLSAAAVGRRPPRWRFDTAAPRWHFWLCAEARLTLPEADLAVAALAALPGPGAIAGGQALVGICDTHGLDDAVGVLDSWLSARD